MLPEVNSYVNSMQQLIFNILQYIWRLLLDSLSTFTLHVNAYSNNFLKDKTAKSGSQSCLKAILFKTLSHVFFKKKKK